MYHFFTHVYQFSTLLIVLSVNNFYNYFIQGINANNSIQLFKHLQFTF